MGNNNGNSDVDFTMVLLAGFSVIRAGAVQQYAVQ